MFRSEGSHRYLDVDGHDEFGVLTVGFETGRRPKYRRDGLDCPCRCHGLVHFESSCPRILDLGTNAILGLTMSMPRKAMQELGFQACCLRCDAPDESGVARCSPCIQHHRNVRELLASAPPDDPLYQLAKEIMAMAAEPHRYDHDEVHGRALIEQQRLAGALVGERAKASTDDIEALFEQQRAKRQQNALQDIANQNPWKERPLEAKEAQAMGEETWVLQGEENIHYGARTVPSKPIQKVDRSERSGEDTALTDRIHAAAATDQALDEETAEIFEELEFKQRQSKREELKSAMKEVKELVDDDLEF